MAPPSVDALADRSEKPTFLDGVALEPKIVEGPVDGPVGTDLCPNKAGPPNDNPGAPVVPAAVVVLAPNRSLDVTCPVLLLTGVKACAPELGTDVCGTLKMLPAPAAVVAALKLNVPLPLPRVPNAEFPDGTSFGD